MARQLAKLKPIHIQAMKYRLQGMTIKEIAAEINKTERAVSSWFHEDDLFKSEYKKMQDESVERARSILINYAPDSAKNIIEIASGNLNGERGIKNMLDANIDILDRVGLKPVEQQEVELNSKVTIVDDVK